MQTKKKLKAIREASLVEKMTKIEFDYVISQYTLFQGKQYCFELLGNVKTLYTIYENRYIYSFEYIYYNVPRDRCPSIRSLLF